MRGREWSNITSPSRALHKGGPADHTLSAHDLRDVLWRWHWNTLCHVLRFLRPVVGRRREPERAGERIRRGETLAEIQHAQLQRQLKGSLVLHQAASAEVAEEARRHFHLWSNFVGGREVALSVTG